MISINQDSIKLPYYFHLYILSEAKTERIEESHRQRYLGAEISRFLR